jgi:hypothetical protein
MAWHSRGMRRRGWLAGLVAVGLMVLACAAPGEQPGDGEPASAPPQAPYGAEVIGVHPGPDESSLVLDLNLPAGAPDCAVDPRPGLVTEENGYLYLSVVYDAPGNETVGRCPEMQVITVTLTFELPVAGKPLVIDLRTWEPGTPDYRLCDEHLGCVPPDDHCDRAWIDEGTADQDLPQHTYVDTVYCDQSWLVLEINTNAGACGAGRPGCSAPPNTRRVFYAWDDRWVAIAGGQEAGCPEALAQYPEFPRAVCAELPAPS